MGTISPPDGNMATLAFGYDLSNNPIPSSMEVEYSNPRVSASFLEIERRHKDGPYLRPQKHGSHGHIIVNRLVRQRGYPFDKASLMYATGLLRDFSLIT